MGGSERIYDIDLISQRIKDEGLPMEVYECYLELRRYP